MTSTVLSARSAAWEGPSDAARSHLERLGGARRRRWAVPRAITRLSGVVVLLAAWQIASATGTLSPLVMGSPHAVASEALDLLRDGSLFSAIGVSLQRVLAGLAFGLVIGTALALLASLSRIGEDLIDAPMQMLRTVPFVGLVPLLIVWLGVGETPKVALIALGVVFPIYINFTAGIRHVDPTLIEAGRSLGLGRIQQIVHVIVPGALPQALVGLRVGLGVSWLALIFAEQISAVNGLGYLMTTSQQLLHTNTIIVCLVVYALLGLLTDQVVRGLERVLLRWRPAGVR
ncbi:ABC transporter permease [Nocardioides sp.]|uniref:ABC transporter permease n=1 Tax=Nocardioides sp. TaxID=35761 RepID=UPI002613F3C3|nr:ABC transporter permease [Nocardioides sp.]